MRPGAGALTIRLRRAGGAARAEVAAPPPLPLDRLFAGREAEEAAALAPALWNVCAAAQEAAARGALGLPQKPDAARRIAAETLREHVLAVCVRWPAALGLPTAPEAARLAGSAADDFRAAEALRGLLFGTGAGAPGDAEALARWAAEGETAPARLIGALLDWPEAWGRVDLPLCAAGAEPDWPEATVGGRPVENTPAARTAGTALMRSILAARGPGPVWRAGARLVEIDRLLAGHPPAAARPGAAQAARGLLFAGAERDGARVVRFERLSPTEFALAPGGLLERSLATLPGEPGAPLAAIARLLVGLVDPCLPVRLEVEDA